LGGPEVNIRLFGGLTVEVAGVDVTGMLPGRKGRAALAFMAIRHPTGATRDELVDVLWPDKRPADPRANLRTLLSRVRDALGPDALEDGRALRIAPDGLATDLAQARSAVAAASSDRDARRAERAVGHARAAVDIMDRPFLPDLDGDWLDRTRRDLDRDLSEMLCCIADMGSLAGGDLGDEAIAAARELVERDGYLERSHGLLMLALARRGEAAEALRVFESVRQQLIDELGTSPGSDLLTLHAAILREEDLGGGSAAGSPAPWSPADVPLPPPVAAAAERAFIGRGRELRMLEELGDSEGHGQIVTVAGPPGIGKSRLITQAALRAGRADHIVLFGRCDEGADVPYQPFVEALRHLLRPWSATEVEDLLDRAQADLARILPELSRGETFSSDEPEAERHRLFEAVVSVLRRLAHTSRVLLVIDDLHWADRPTQRMLLHIERAVRDLPVSIVIANRNTVADQREGFRDLLADIRREREVVAITLDGLGDAELRAMVSAEFGGGLPDSLVEVIGSRTGGNPLLARELIRDIQHHHGGRGWPDDQQLRMWPVPEGIQQLTMRRLAAFSSTDRDLIGRAASLGRVVRPTELAATANEPLTVALALLERAADAGFVVDRLSEPGAFAFGHPLIRDAIVASISPTRLAHMHLENAQRLEQHWTGPSLELHLPELAHHRVAAAAAGLEVEAAVDCVEKAARHAERQLAYEASAVHYSRALELLADNPASRRRRASLLLALAAAHWRSGHRDDSRVARREAFDIAIHLDDAELMAAAAIGHERYFELTSFEPDEHAMARQALSRLPDQPTGRRAQLLARLSRIDHWTGDRTLTTTVATEAVRLARDAGGGEVLADALNALLLAYRVPGHPIHARLMAASELIELGRDLDMDERRLEGEAHRLLAIVEGGRTTEIRGAVERFGRIVEGVRQPFWVYFRQAWAATLAFNEGNLDRAERLAEIATATATGARSDAADLGASATVQRMVEQGRASEVFDLTSEFVTAGVHDGVWRAGVALVLARAGRSDEAKACLRQMVGADRIRLPMDVLWGMGACLLADAAHAVGDQDAARTIYRELEPRPRWIAMAGTARGFLLVSQRLGLLAQVMGDHSRALAHLAEARRQGQDLSAGLIVTWADLESAATLLDRGAPEDVTRAHVLLAAVERFAEGRGLGLIEQRITALRAGSLSGPAFAI
jgi:DNA-binding SARP family transcriptional activator/tetratricopeptide (TPR) repeat protein